MRRGYVYRINRPSDDPKKHRVFVVVSRQVTLDSLFSTVICAPVFFRGHGLATQVSLGTAEGLKHDSWVFCDNLTSIRKSELTQFIGSLSPDKLLELDRALKQALGLR